MWSHLQVLVRILSIFPQLIQMCADCPRNGAHVAKLSCVCASSLTGKAGALRVADWFAQLNEKMGGDLKKIKVVGEYMIEIWKACGMEGIGDSSKVH